jgi:AraC-like DNA-binding protein
MLSAPVDLPFIDLPSLAREVTGTACQGILVVPLEKVVKESALFNLPHRVHFFSIMLMNSGSGTQRVDTETFSIGPNALLFMHEGQTHGWEMTPDTTGCCLFFTQSFFDLHAEKQHTLLDFPLFQQYVPQPFFHLGHQEMRLEVGQLFGNLLKEYQRLPHDADHEKILWSYLNILLLKIKRYMPASVAASQGVHHLVRTFELLASQHVTHQKSVAAYAEMLHVSPNHLNALCKKVLGKNAKTLLNERLLLEAQRLLVYSPKTVAEIAYGLDFHDSSYFSRFFKKMTGVSPEVYRSMAADSQLV